jgi:phosphatidylglycerophosphatase A
VVWRRANEAWAGNLWLSSGGADLDRRGALAGAIVARESGREDPGFVVIDEVAGQWIALIAIKPDWKHAALALFLFRLFDIWKPWPIRRLEELPEGTGIMLDDVAAGLLALLCGLAAARWI